MANGSTGEHLGEWEKGEAYMILSRNNVANYGALINRLLDSSLHRGGSKVHMAKGGLYADGGVKGTVSANPTGDFGILVQEVRGVREEIRTQKTLLKAYVVAFEVGNQLNELQEIEQQASL